MTNQKSKANFLDNNIHNSLFKKAIKQTIPSPLYRKSSFEKSFLLNKELQPGREVSKSTHLQNLPNIPRLIKQKSLNILCSLKETKTSPKLSEVMIEDRIFPKMYPPFSKQHSPLTKYGKEPVTRNSRISKGTRNHKSEKSLFKSSLFDDKRLRTKGKAFSRTAKRSNMEMTEADKSYILKSPNNPPSSINFEIKMSGEFDSNAETHAAERELVNVNEFHHIPLRNQVNNINVISNFPKSITSRKPTSQNSVKNSSESIKKKKDSKRLPPILNRSMQVPQMDSESIQLRDTMQVSNTLNPNSINSKDQLFEYSLENSNIKETNKKAGLIKEHNFILEQSGKLVDSTFKNQASMDSMLPIARLLKEVDIKKPGTLIMDNDIEDQVISFNLNNLSEEDYDKLMKLMINFNMMRANNMKVKSSSQSFSQMNQKDATIKELESIKEQFVGFSDLKEIKENLLKKIEQLNKRNKELDDTISQIRKMHEEELIFCKKEIYLLIEKNLLFRENFETVILQVIDIADKMVKRKVELSNENHMKIIGELVENINIMTRKINMDFNQKLNKIKHEFELKLMFLKKKNLELERQNKNLEKDVEVLKQLSSKERINDLIEKQLSIHVSKINEKFNSKIEYISDSFSRKFNKLKNECAPSTKYIPPLKLQNSKKNRKHKEKERGNLSNRNIEIPKFDEFVTSPKRKEKKEPKPFSFLKQIFSKERKHPTQTYESNFLNDRSLPINAIMNSKKARASNRSRKNRTIMDMDIRKYQSSQPDNYIEELRFQPNQSNFPFSKTERKNFPISSKNDTLDDDFMTKFNKITNYKGGNVHSKKRSLHLKSTYVGDAKKMKQRKIRIMEKDFQKYPIQ